MAKSNHTRRRALSWLRDSPGEDNLSDEFLGALAVEVSRASLVVHLVHDVQHGVHAHDLVADVRHQHHASLELGDRSDETRPHLQPVRTR